MSDTPGIAIVGAGSIGRRIAQAVRDGELPCALRAVYDTDPAAAQRLLTDFSPNSGLVPAAGLSDAMALADVLVECAAGRAVSGIVAAARDSHALCGRPQHLLVMSVGGLLGVPFPEDDQPGPVIHVPSGAIGGLDAVQALAVAGLEEVTLTTSKPPAALGLDVSEYTVVFEGAACDVIEKFPKNVNVAIALSFAGLGAHRTKVRLVADPTEQRNVHHIVARGAAGEVEFISRNVPFPDNPRTSYLAALSAISLLRRIFTRFQVG